MAESDTFLPWSGWIGDGQVPVQGTTGHVEYELKLTSDGMGRPEVYDVTLHFQNLNPGKTPIGYNVNVPLLNTMLSFDQVPDSGTTQASIPPPIQNPPGYRKIRILDLITSAQFTGLVKLDIGFDKTVIQDPNTLQLFHWDNGEWEDITDFVDADNAKISGYTTNLSPFFVGEYDAVTGIVDKPTAPIPRLSIKSYPNPFNPQITVDYVIGTSGPVSVRVYDVKGRLVHTLVNAPRLAGEYAITWAGQNARGGLVASGVYFVRLESSGQVRTSKIVLLK